MTDSSSHTDNLDWLQRVRPVGCQHLRQLGACPLPVASWGSLFKLVRQFRDCERDSSACIACCAERLSQDGQERVHRARQTKEEGSQGRVDRARLAQLCVSALRKLTFHCGDSCAPSPSERKVSRLKPYVFDLPQPKGKADSRVLHDPPENTNLKTIIWDEKVQDKCDDESPSGCCKSSIWLSRLRTGHTTAERRSARWTIDGSVCSSECTHERLLSTCPETRFRKAGAFRDHSVDVLVVDTSVKQDYEAFLGRIVSLLALGSERASQETAVDKETSLHDRAFYAARQMFRES